MAIRLGTEETAVYALSEGRQMPEFLSERQRRNLQKSDEEVRRRISLLQDFEFENGTSQRLNFSGDGQFLIVTGMYPPRCKVYEVSQLGMKYERRLGSECVDVCPLTEDLGKIAFLLSDRTLELHAPYGTHYKVRVPSFGRSLAYDAARCILWTAASGGQVHGLDLDAGSFIAPLLATDSQAAFLKGVGFTRLQLAPPALPLLAAAAEDGKTRFYDTRTRGPVSTLYDNEDPTEISALAFDPELRGLRLATGNAQGIIKVYDMRKNQPLLSKQHQYELPIQEIHFAKPPMSQGAQEGLILSADARLLKLWNANKGDVLVNIETAAPLTRAVIAPLNNSSSTSGLILAAGDQPRMMSYYIPKLGPAPRWCSFLESITEELEEAEPTAFDDLKFVSKSELAELEAEHLVGTNQAKPYMHGFFIDTKLYRKLKAIAKPFAYEDWRKEQQQKKIIQKRETSFNGIIESSKPKKKLPKVNAAFAERILQITASESETAINPLNDDRFSKLFTDKHFQIDEEAPEYLARHPNSGKQQQSPQSSMPEPMSMQQAEEDEDYHPKKTKRRLVLATHTGLDAVAALGLDHPSIDDTSSSWQDDNSKPLGKRLKAARGPDTSDPSADAYSSRILGEDDEGDGFIKEITFIPKSSSSGDGLSSAPDSGKKKKKNRQKNKHVTKTL